MAEPELPIPHFVTLPPNTDNPEEPLRYDCSLCDKDVYNISMHAQFEHGVRQFTVSHEETPRDYGVVGHLCGIKGCSFDGNHDGDHSWETSFATEVVSESSAAAPPEQEIDDGWTEV